MHILKCNATLTAFLHVAVLPCDVHIVSHPEFTEHCLSSCQERKASLFSREIAAKNCQMFAFFIIYVLIVMLIFPELPYLFLLEKNLNYDLLLFHHFSSLKRFLFWICTKFLTKTIRKDNWSKNNNFSNGIVFVASIWGLHCSHQYSLDLLASEVHIVKKHVAKELRYSY